MKGIEKLHFLTEEQKEYILTSAKNYKRHASVLLEVLKVDNKAITIKIQQEPNVTNKYLSKKELINRAKEVFEGLGYDVHVHATECIIYGLHDITTDIVNEKIRALGFTQVNTARYLNLDTASLNRLLTGERELTKVHKSMFFYFFKTLEELK